VRGVTVWVGRDGLAISTSTSLLSFKPSRSLCFLVVHCLYILQEVGL
jgi:hypothetical protein